MQKILTILLIFLSVSCFGQKKNYRIGVLFDSVDSVSKDYVHKKLRKEVKAVVGEDATMVFHKSDILTNGYSIKVANENYEELLKRCDIIISFGKFNNFILFHNKVYPKPVIAIGDIFGGDRKKITKNTTSGIKNLLYLTYSENILSRLQILQKISNFKTVGIVVEDPIAELVDFNSLVSGVLKGEKIRYKLIRYKTLNDIVKNLDGLDALYLASSFSLKKEEVRELSRLLIKHKIVSFSAIRKDDVENGILATNISNYDLSRFFRRIALSIESYVNGTNFSKLPVLIDAGKLVIINRSTALALGIPFSYKVLEGVKFIDNPEFNPNAKEIYSLPRLISVVLNKNLSLQSESKEVKIGSQKIKSAKSTYLPNVKVSVRGAYLDPEVAKISNGNNPEISTMGNISLEQVLFSAEANSNIAVQRSLAKAQREKFNVRQLDTIFDAVKAYFNVLILKTNVKIQWNNLSLTKRNLQIAEENFRAGQSGKTDVLRLKSQKAQNSQALIESVNRLKKAITT